MKNDAKYITVNHLDDFSRFGYTRFRVGEQLVLKKDHDNCYDDEAIQVNDRSGSKVGYVANSVSSVARGTYSAGRIYDQIEEETECIVRFITEDILIVEIIN